MEPALLIKIEDVTKVKASVTVVILTYNESIHIRRAIQNVMDWCEEVVVLDSNSTDDTASIAEQAGAKVYYRAFDNYASQRNYAIQHLPVSTEWILFLDADEYLSEELKQEITQVLQSGSEMNGYYMKRRFYFMDKWIRWGGYYPTWILRLFKKDKGLFEREVNEHVVIDGPTAKLKNDFADKNNKLFSFWWAKHLQYARKEAEDLYKENKLHESFKLNGSQAARKSWLRYKVWNRMPVMIRPFIYFFYRYFLRLGFLDGRVGFIFHFMHGLVYFLLIDIFYLELKTKGKR